MSALIEIFAGIFLDRFLPKRREFIWRHSVEDDTAIIQGTEITQRIPKVIMYGYLSINLLLAFLLVLALAFLFDDIVGNFLLIVITAVITLSVFIIFVITGSAAETKVGKKLWYDFKPVKIIKRNDKLTINRLDESGDINESIDISWEHIQGISLEKRDIDMIHLKIKVTRDIIPKPVGIIFPQRGHSKLKSMVKDIGEKIKLENISKGNKIEYGVIQ